MKINHNGHIIEMYDSIQSLPITRFMAYNLNLMIDGGIGSDMNAFSQHISSTVQLIDRDPEEAKKRLLNMHQNFQMIISKTSPKMHSFVVMIKKINGRTIKDDELSEDGIKAIIEELGHKRLPYGKIVHFLNEVKKKSITSSRFSFPKWLGILKRPNSIIT